MGFSDSAAGTPCWAACSIRSMCVLFGEPITTASTPSSASTAATSAVARAPCLPASSFAGPSIGSQTQASSASRVGRDRLRVHRADPSAAEQGDSRHGVNTGADGTEARTAAQPPLVRRRRLRSFGHRSRPRRWATSRRTTRASRSSRSSTPGVTSTRATRISNSAPRRSSAACGRREASRSRCPRCRVRNVPEADDDAVPQSAGDGDRGAAAVVSDGRRGADGRM